MIKRVGTLMAVTLVALLLGACAGMSAPHPAVGSWELTIDTPLGAMSSDLAVNEDMTGTMSSQDLGTAPLSQVSLGEQNMLNFAVEIDAQGTAMVLDFSGVVNGDTLTGNFDTDFGAIPVTGQRM